MWERLSNKCCLSSLPKVKTTYPKIFSQRVRLHPVLGRQVDAAPLENGGRKDEILNAHVVHQNATGHVEAGQDRAEPADHGEGFVVAGLAPVSEIEFLQIWQL